jgi:hypothetical protein
MYLVFFVVFIAIIVIAGGIFSGGIFTIILVPLAIIAVVSAIAYTAIGRAAGADETEKRRPEKRPIRRKGVEPGANGDVPVTPDEYVDALQKNQ